MPPLVSVVLPSYGHAGFVEQAIRSVLDQTLSDLELIVIDDASLDRSWARIEQVADPRLKAVRNCSNKGAHVTLNLGLAMAEGEYVAILNSDDLFSQDRLERMLDAMRAEGASFAFSDVCWIDHNGQALSSQHSRVVNYQHLSSWCRVRNPANWFLAGNPAITTSNFLFRRELIDGLHEFPPLRYTHDWASLLHFAATGRMLWLHEPLLSYRVHAANTLNESDAWRHIHENAWVQTLALKLLPDICHAQGFDINSDQEREELLKSWLRNASGPPLVTLLYLVAAAAFQPLGSSSTQEFLRYVQQLPTGWFAERIGLVSGLSVRLFQSLADLEGVVNTVDAQATLLEERYVAMEEMGQEIRRRDQRIDSIQADLNDLAGQHQALEAYVAKLQSHPLFRATRAVKQALRILISPLRRAA